MICNSCPNILSLSGNWLLSQRRRKPGYSGSGYPWELTEEQVTKILENFPKTFDENITRRFTMYDVFLFRDKEFQKSLFDKMQTRPDDKKNRREFRRSSTAKWKWLVKYLLKHPSLVTKEMNEIIQSSELLKTYFIIRNFDITPVTEDKSVLTITQVNTDSPLANLEAKKLEISEKLIDRIDLVIDMMTPAKIQKASIGTQFKGLRDLIQSYTMFKSEGISNNLNQINIKNLNVLQARELSRKAATN